MKGSNKLHHRPYIPLNRMDEADKPYICRLAPFADGFELEFLAKGAENQVLYRKCGESEWASVKAKNRCMRIEHLEQNIDYECKVTEENAAESKIRLVRTGAVPEGAVVINLSSEGKNNIMHSSSFVAKSGQFLTLEITSSIKGGADLFLFSPSKQEQRITIGGRSETKTIALSEGIWSYNCTGFFDSGDLSIVGTLSSSHSAETEETPSAPTIADSISTDPVVINLSSGGQNSIVHSSSFEAKSGQILTLEVNSSIDGTVDLFLFSPANQEQHITMGGNNETKTIVLSEGRWSYNCTGFFDSGDISIVGTLE